MQDMTAYFPARLRSGLALLKTPSAQRIGWGLAVLIFVGGLWASARMRPELFRDIDVGLFLVLIFGFCPAVIAINAAMLRLSGTIAGAAFSRAEALRLSVLSSALNHLPLPGGVLLRVGAMRARGADLLTAGAVNLSAAVLWLGFSLVYAGGWALSAAPLLGVLCISAGLIALACGALIGWRIRRDWRDVSRLAGLSALPPVVYSVGLWAGFHALGVAATFQEAGVVSGAGVIGSAASILPAGLGAREAAGAFLASQIGVDPYSAFVATAFVHVAMMAALALASAVFALRRATHQR